MAEKKEEKIKEEKILAPDPEEVVAREGEQA